MMEKKIKTIINGDCIEVMKTMAEQSVQCCVTSPPYFGLRDYGNDGQIGLEETPEAFVAKLVEVFREVKRVLADDGRLYERTFKCWRFDHLGSHSEYFDSLVEAVEFAQEQAGEPREPWPVVAKMAAAAANYHRKLTNERI